MLSATARLPDLDRLIDRQACFVIHGPSQSGKTTAMNSLAHELTASGAYAAVLVSMEVGAPFNHDPGVAELAILESWRAAAEWHLPARFHPPAWPNAASGGRIGAALAAWCHAIERPLVLFLDEIDALSGAALVSILHQLRSGFGQRPTAFPWALALVGMRDVRDYKVAVDGSELPQMASPFNIKTESLLLRMFTAAEVAELYCQHTAETGQEFTTAAVERAFALTQGQPWLVNALARQAVEVVVPHVGAVIDAPHIDRAMELLLQRQDTHFDSMAECLRELRVRRVVEPIMAHAAIQDSTPDDIRYAIELGLCRRTAEGKLVIANPIYGEVLPWILAATPSASLRQIFWPIIDTTAYGCWAAHLAMRSLPF